MLTIGGRDFAVDVLNETDVRVDGEPVQVAVRHRRRLQLAADGGSTVAWSVADGDARWVYADGCLYRFELQISGGRRRGHHGSLAAPMPATVRQVNVKPGDLVTRGQTVVVLEAMKMELPVRATADGTVTAVNCTEGQLVQPGVALVDIDET